MKFRIPLLVAIAAFLLTSLAMAADVTGKWTAEVPGRNGQTRTQTFDLKADGDKLTGTVSSPMGETPITDGKVSGSDISFTVTMEMNGNKREMKYTGTLSGDELKMKREGGRAPQEFTAKRATS